MGYERNQANGNYTRLRMKKKSKGIMETKTCVTFLRVSAPLKDCDKHMCP